MSQSKSPLAVDAILVPSSPLNRGRPSKPQQLNIERTLREFFARGMSASFASRKTAHNIKTVTKYYDQFMAEIEEGDKEDFFDRKRADSIQRRLVHDELCQDLFQDKMEIENLIKEALAARDFKSLQNLYNSKLKINQEIYKRAIAKTTLGYNDRSKTWLEEFEERYPKIN